MKEKLKVTSKATIFIGLGSLGCDSVDMLKGQFTKEFEQSDHVYFMNLDTDHITLKNNNNMNDHEKILLFDPDINLSSHFNEWLDQRLYNRMIRNGGRGASCIRQIGKIWLVNDFIYNKTKIRLRNLFNEIMNCHFSLLDNHAMQIILVTSIAGGTGSGMVIDFTYMIHNIFKEISFENYTIAGYIYTPDVHFDCPGVKNNRDVQLNLQSNGYAALKEIDYFMNIETTGNSYNLKLETEEIVSNKNLFTACNFVSGYGIKTTMKRLTDHLSDVLLFNGEGLLSEPLLCDESVMLNDWFALHTDRKYFHRYASYKYQKIDHSVIKIPDKEIYAYCTKQIYHTVLKQLKNTGIVNKQMLDSVYCITHIDTITSLKQYVLELNGKIRRDIVIEDNITKMMIKQDPMCGYNLAVNLAQYYSQNLTLKFKRKFEDSLFEELSKQLDKIFKDYGPYVVLKVIKHNQNEDEPFSGIEEQLTELSKSFKTRAKKARDTYANGGERIIRNLADTACRILSTNKDVIAYKDECVKLAVISEIDTLLYELIADGLNHVLIQIRELSKKYLDVQSRIENGFKDEENYFTANNDPHDFFKIQFEDINHIKCYADSIIADALGRVILLVRLNGWTIDNDSIYDYIVQEDFIEKLLFVAYSQTDFTSTDLNDIWNNHDCKKMREQILQQAADDIFNICFHTQKSLVELDEFDYTSLGKREVFSCFGESRLSVLLENIAINHGMNVVKNTTGIPNRFTLTTVYKSVPLYAIRGMFECYEAYKHYYPVKAGIHLYANNNQLNKYSQPYTIDSFINKIYSYVSGSEALLKFLSDDMQYVSLMSAKDKIDRGIDALHFIKVSDDNETMVLMNVVKEPDENIFKNSIESQLKSDVDIDVVQLMKENGYIINEIVVDKGYTDIDFNRNLNDVHDDRYINLLLPIADVYKYLYSSVYYMSIIETNILKFEKAINIINEVKEKIV